MSRMKPMATSELFEEKEIRNFHILAILNAIKARYPDDNALHDQAYYHYLQHQEYN